MPQGVRFLTLGHILLIHSRALEADGGDDGTLKQDALESAIAAPQATYGGAHLNAFPFEMAAAYLVGFTLNHAFVDGNKRVAAVTAAMFLEINGWRLELAPDAFAALVLAVARGELAKPVVAQTLEAASIRVGASRAARPTKPRGKRRR